MRWRNVLRPLRRTAMGASLATSRLRPMHWLPSWRAARRLWFDYGHLQSVRLGQAIDGRGDIIPWYTYPAIDFLKQFDFGGKHVFEFGSGNSSIFWARRAASVVSVEDEEGWVEQLRPRLPANCTLLYEPDLRRYPERIHDAGVTYDIIIVDGPGRGRTRMRCAWAALQRLNAGGLIILDNSDWVPGTAAVLREADLLQVDMSGFAPITSHTQTTSFFFHRECRLQPIERQPVWSAGAQRMNWDAPPTHRFPPETVLTFDQHTFYGVCHDESITKVTPGGSRRFRLLAYGEEGQRMGILDSDAGRVLLVGHQSPAGVGPELARLRRMEWTQFREFVRRHDNRFYRLE